MTLPQTTSHAANNQSSLMPPASLTYIDQERILQETFVRGWNTIRVPTSTNDRAAQAAAEGARELPLLIVADRQTAGRGRGSHRWWSDAGGLTMSLLLGPELFPGPSRSRAPLVALAAAVAVVETLAPLLPGHPLGLHWPERRAGRPAEAGGHSHRSAFRRAARCGHRGEHQQLVGRRPAHAANASHHAPRLDRPAAQPDEHSHRPAAGIGTDFAALASDGPRIAARADALCLQRGQTLTVEHGRRAVTGLCLGIAPDGALRLKTPAGEQRFYSGALRQP